MELRCSHSSQSQSQSQDSSISMAKTTGIATEEPGPLLLLGNEGPASGTETETPGRKPPLFVVYDCKYCQLLFETIKEHTDCDVRRALTEPPAAPPAPAPRQRRKRKRRRLTRTSLDPTTPIRGKKSKPGQASVNRRCGCPKKNASTPKIPIANEEQLGQFIPGAEEGCGQAQEQAHPQIATPAPVIEVITYYDHDHDYCYSALPEVDADHCYSAPAPEAPEIDTDHCYSAPDAADPAIGMNLDHCYTGSTPTSGPGPNPSAIGPVLCSPDPQFVVPSLENLEKLLLTPTEDRSPVMKFTEFTQRRNASHVSQAEPNTKRRCQRLKDKQYKFTYDSDDDDTDQGEPRLERRCQRLRDKEYNFACDSDDDDTDSSELLFEPKTKRRCERLKDKQYNFTYEYDSDDSDTNEWCLQSIE